jgi:hypothetical protein
MVCDIVYEVRNVIISDMLSTEVFGVGLGFRARPVWHLDPAAYPDCSSFRHILTAYAANMLRGS